MKIKIYNEDGTTFSEATDLEDAIPGDDQDAETLREEARIALLDVGRFWIGGGASPLFLMHRI